MKRGVYLDYRNTANTLFLNKKALVTQAGGYQKYC